MCSYTVPLDYCLDASGGALLYDLLGRITTAPEPFRLDMFLGAVAQRTSITDTTEMIWDPKIGIEMRWMFVPAFVGMLLKYSTTFPRSDPWHIRYPNTLLGVGIAVGYQP